MRIVYHYLHAPDEMVAFAIQTLREHSPVGSVGDKHPGLYRDSHLIFIDGHVVKDVSSWQPGQQINISNPVPYSRKIDAGTMEMSVPAHVYEKAAPIIDARYGNTFNIKFVFMPIRFGDNQAWASFTKMQRTGRKLSEKARADWLVRQPALEIRAR
jgi:hypothetical protein